MHLWLILTFAGGQHRKQATEIVKKQSEERTAKYREQIEEIKVKLEEAKAGSMTAESLEKKVRLQVAQIDVEKELQGKIGIWGVALYDASESLTQVWDEGLRLIC